jgi:5-formyltetrahydrofolate cyclo-ligase
MSADTIEQKRALRPALIARRGEIGEREARSAAIRERVVSLPVFQRARAIHSFISIGAEVDTHALIAAALAQGKAVAVPVVERGRRLSHSWIKDIDPADFAAGVMGTLAPRVIIPAALGDWELTIVPMLGFDREGYRIGYGMGYYDKILAAAPTISVGVAFAAQEVATLPHEAHDVPLDMIVTEDEVIIVE